MDNAPCWYDVRDVKVDNCLWYLLSALGGVVSGSPPFSSNSLVASSKVLISFELERRR